MHFNPKKKWRNTENAIIPNTKLFLPNGTRNRYRTEKDFSSVKKKNRKKKEEYTDIRQQT